MVALIGVAVNNRDAVVNDMRIAIREVVGIAKNTFGDGSAEYKTFKAGDMTRVDASDLSFLSVTIVARGNAYLAQMTPKGLTAAMLTNITTLKGTLDARIKDVETAQANQLTTTQTRHNAANSLFDEMSAMCDAAQVYYADRNPLKASEYIIYDTVGTTQQRNGTVAGNSVVSRSLTGVTPDSNFKLQVKNGTELSFYFSQTDGGDSSGTEIRVDINPNNYTETTAALMGFNASTGYIVFCIKQ